MAEIRAFPKSGANILGGLAQGAQIAGGIQNIQASRANVALANQAAQQQAQQQQFAQEQVVKQQEQTKLTTQLDRTDKLINSAMSKGMLKSNPEFMRKLIDSSNVTSSQLFPDSPNFDFDAILNNSEQFEKDWKAHQLMENEGMHEEAAQFLNEIMPNYLQQPKELAAITGAQKIGAESLVKAQKADIVRKTFTSSRFPDVTTEQITTAGQIALESSVEKGAEYLRQVAEEDEAIKYIKVDTVSEEGTPVTAFLNPADLTTVKEIPREGKGIGKPQILEVGLPGFPNWMQKAEVTKERDAQGNLILKPVGSPFQKEAPIDPRLQTDTPIGLGGDTPEVTGPEPSRGGRKVTPGIAPRKPSKGFAPRTPAGGKAPRTPLIKSKEYLGIARSSERYKDAIKGLSKKEIKTFDDKIIKIWADLFNDGRIPIGVTK